MSAAWRNDSNSPCRSSQTLEPAAWGDAAECAGSTSGATNSNESRSRMDDPFNRPPHGRASASVPRRAVTCRASSANTRQAARSSRLRNRRTVRLSATSKRSGGAIFSPDCRETPPCRRGQRMITALERVLGLRRGERTRALLLFAYLFLVIATSVAGKATRDALFLQQHDAARLPYADAAVALGVVALVALYVRARRAMNLLALQIGSLLLFSTGALALWWVGQGGAAPAWHPAVVYLWVGVFGALGPVQVWTLANYVLTLREAKRLFGLVGGGAILGWVVGGLMTTATAGRYGADNVLLALAAALAACAALVFVIWRRRPAAFGDEEPEASGRALSPASLCESLALVARSPYLRALALVIACSSLVTGIAAWQFKAIAKAYIPATDELASFFGWFNVCAGLLALATQCLATSRVLRRFGVGVALFIVPVSLVLGSVGLLAWGTLAAAVVLKGSDHVLRYSIDKSTVETLFLPVPAEQTFHAKLVIDGIVWRAGDVAGSAILLVAVAGLGVSAVGVGWINLVLLGGWMAIAWGDYR
ncbi:MAG: hypothetical protein EHM24_06200, partial [Acidobacteria bacterium]